MSEDEFMSLWERVMFDDEALITLLNLCDSVYVKKV